MSSIISTQENSNTSLIEASKARKKEKEEEQSVQFYNVIFDSNIDKATMFVRKSQLSALVEALKKEQETQSSEQNDTRVDIFNLKTLDYTDTIQVIEQDELSQEILNNLIDKYKENENFTDYQSSKKYLLALMNNLIDEFRLDGFDTSELISLRNTYHKGISDIKSLRKEIIAKAEKAITQSDKVEFNNLYDFVSTSLYSYTGKKKDENSSLYDFFTLVSGYLKNEVKDKVAQAIATMQNSKDKNESNIDL